MRIEVGGLRRKAHAAEQLDGAGAGGLARQPCMEAQGLGDLRACTHHWIQGREGIVEHHRDILPSHLRETPLVHPEKLLAEQLHAPRGVCASRQQM